MVIIVVVTSLADYVLTMKYDENPRFTYKEENGTYYGFIYQIKYTSDSKTFLIFNYKLEEKKLEIKKVFEVIDKSKEVCTPSQDYFYQDKEYRYYFNCVKEYYIKIGKVEYTLKNALENNLITINDLQEKGIAFEKETIN